MVIWALLSGAAWAEGEKAGDFDYYVMALSWSPNWCATTGDARDADQCDPKHDYGWILHGLWPQFERGYPSNCRTSKRDPSRSQTRAMSDIMASGGLAWHQWKKHGRCSGLSSDDYFALSRETYGSVTRPSVLRKLEKTVRLPATLIEEAFLEANPKLDPEMITITCKGKYVQEARICMTKDLQFRTCGPDVIRDCTAKVLFDPIR
jgi:ribonuclease T2